ncbi:MAG: guanylate kinase [Oscillospiraceae bacterium]|nr:guanylate kinase [Oscillospiraceae bacterium]
MNKGQLIVFSGPSGVGKGTVLKEFLQHRDNVSLSISATTRQPRPGEENAVHYYFLTREEFEQRIAENNMLEYAQYNGNYYGTPKDKVEEALEQGRDIILEIEVQGALLVKEKCPNALLVFVMPPSWQELRDRLTGRGTEDAETIEKRLNIAQGELKQAIHYDYILVNDQVEAAAKRLEHIMESGRCRIVEMKDFIREVDQHA